MGFGPVWGNATAVEGLKRTMTKKGHQEISGDRRSFLIFWEMEEICWEVSKKGHSKISSKI